MARVRGRLVIRVSFLYCAFFVACGGEEAPAPEPAAPEAAPRPAVTAALLERGEKLFKKHCTACHGEKGTGDGAAAYLLYPKPRNFTSGTFRLVSTDNGPTDRDLFDTISRGMPGSAMPSWGHLPAQDRWALIAEVRRLAKEGYLANLLAGGSMARKEAEQAAEEDLAPGTPVEVPPETERSLQSLARGEVLYMRSCAPCHDADGRGLQRKDLKDNDGYPIYARDFTRGVFKGSPEGPALARRILAGLPGTPMPANEELGQEPDDLWAVVHFVMSLVPAGAQSRVLQVRRTITAHRTSGALPGDPGDAAWKKVEPTYVALMPLWWRPGSTQGLLVRALHDGKRIALRLTWVDASEDRLSLRTEQFADAVAVELSATADPPLFAMGAKASPVAIWQWRAQWESEKGGRASIRAIYPRTITDRGTDAGRETPLVAAASRRKEYQTAAASGNRIAAQARSSSVQALAAEGFGTLTARGSAARKVTGAARWDRGVWDVVFQRDLDPGGDGIRLAPGSERNIAFAVWDGAARERDGQKSVTIWQALRIEN